VGKGRRGERLHAHTRVIGVPSTPNRAPCRSRPFEAFRGHQRRSEANRGHQRAAEAIRGQVRTMLTESPIRQAIRGHQRPLEGIGRTMLTEYDRRQFEKPPPPTCGERTPW